MNNPSNPPQKVIKRSNKIQKSHEFHSADVNFTESRSKQLFKN